MKLARAVLQSAKRRRSISPLAYVASVPCQPGGVLPMATSIASPRQSLQQLIDQAAPNTTLLLAPGIYLGAIAINKPLTLQFSSQGAAIIDGQGGDKGSPIAGGCARGGAILATAKVKLINLVVQNGYYNNIDLDAGSDGSLVYGCAILNWGMQPSGHTDSTQCSGVQILGKGVTVQGNYFQRSGHFFPLSTINYAANWQNWAAITAFNASQGDHSIETNYIDGGYADYYVPVTDSNGVESYIPSSVPHYIPSINDGITCDQWVGNTHAYDNSTIDNNVVVGCWDDNIEDANGSGINLVITNNFVDGMRYSRSCVAVVGTVTGPTYIGQQGQGNVFKNWNFGNTAIKDGYYPAGGAGPKYVQYNLFWSDLSHWIIDDTDKAYDASGNTLSTNIHLDYNHIYTLDGTVKTYALASHNGNTVGVYSSYLEPPTPINSAFASAPPTNPPSTSSSSDLLTALMPAVAMMAMLGIMAAVATP